MAKDWRKLYNAMREELSNQYGESADQQDALERYPHWPDEVKAVRAKALEEAARTVEQLAQSTVRYEERDVYEIAADAIRALQRQ